MSRGPEAEIKPITILSVMLASPDPAFTVAEIAEELGMTRQGVNYRLNQLHEDDSVARKRIGSRAVAWWLV